jgi:hypothetical protein
MAQTEENFVIEIADARGLHKITVTPEEYGYLMNGGVSVYSDQSIQRPLELEWIIPEPPTETETEYSDEYERHDGWDSDD